MAPIRWRPQMVLDELFGFTAKPLKSLSWTVNYYFWHFGQDHPNRVVVPPTSPIPVQPGLSFEPIIPAPDGRTHIFDTYATWQATPKLTLQGEAAVFDNTDIMNPAPAILVLETVNGHIIWLGPQVPEWTLNALRGTAYEVTEQLRRQIPSGPAAMSASATSHNGKAAKIATDAALLVP